MSYLDKSLSQRRPKEYEILNFIAPWIFIPDTIKFRQLFFTGPFKELKGTIVLGREKEGERTDEARKLVKQISPPRDLARACNRDMDQIRARYGRQIPP